MRRFLPLAAGLGLVLVATSALASGAGVRQGTNRRTDLLGDQARAPRAESDAASLSTTRETRVDAGAQAPVDAPRVPVMTPPSLLDRDWPADPFQRESISELSSQRDVRSTNYRTDGILLTDDPSSRVVLEQGRHAPRALVAHGLTEAGGERVLSRR